MKSNLSVLSNLMIDDKDHKPEYKFLPGDYVGRIYQHYVDVQAMNQFLTPKQIVELKQYLPCLKCGRTCAGTCSTA